MLYLLCLYFKAYVIVVKADFKRTIYLKKKLLVAINKPVNSVPVNESNQSGSLATNVFIKSFD